MPRREDIGGFYYGLGVETDRGSFARALEAITGIKAAWLAAAGAIAGTTLIAGKAVDSVKLAEHIGIGTTALEKWKTAAAMAKVSSSALLGEMASLNDKMVEFKKSGTIDRGLADNLGLLAQKSGDKSIGNYAAFAAMGAEERFRAVFAAAAKLSDPAEARKFINDILGGNAASMHDFLRATGGSLEGLLGKAAGLTFTNEQSKTDAAKAYSEIQGTIKAITGMGTLIGEQIAIGLGAGAAVANKWIIDHKKDILAVFEEVGKGTKKVFNKLGETWGEKLEPIKKWFEAHPITTEDITKAIGIGFDKAEEMIGILSDLTDNIAKFAVAIGKDVWQTMLDAWTKAESVAKWIWEHVPHFNTPLGNGDINLDDMYTTDGVSIGDENFKSWFWGEFLSALTLGIYKPKGAVKDGIISPGGGITQVDSHDWVLAFRNLEDVAGAFHTGEGGGGVANVTISQSFQIGSNVRDLPGTIREQAYKGTFSAIGEMFQNTARIVQLMPATR